MSINPCNIHSQKFSAFLSEPLGDKMLYKLPGIGINTFKKIRKTKQITKAEELLYEFIQIFKSNDKKFRLWLMKDYAVPEYRATECVIALIDYIDQAKKNHWPLP
jgi:succinate dehydrogenase flavin-adding protein (antitoxin of CptAB toxin-antitoxin module)